MAVLDKLMVIISANAKEFNSTMDGVVAKTEKTQSAMGKISETGKAVGINLAKGFAIAAASAGAFAFAVKKVGASLEQYGGLVDDKVTSSFQAMNRAIDGVSQTMTLTLADAMSNASGGFVMLMDKIKDVAKESTVLKLLMTGLGYIFAILAVSIDKIGSVLSITADSFRIMGKAIEMASNSMSDWINGTDNAAEANANLDKEIDALFEGQKPKLDSLLDMDAFGRAIEEAQQKTAEFANRVPELINKAGKDKPPWMRAYLTGLQELRAATDVAIMGMSARIKANDDLQYENELRKSQRTLDLLNLEVERRVWAHNKIAELEVMKTQIINANLQEQESVKARHDANWQSSEQYRLDFVSGILGSMATLMDSGNKKMFAAGKVFAISKAILDTYSGIAASLKLGFPMGWVAAAATAVAGFANVAKIKNTQFGGGGGGTSSPVKPNMESQAAAPAAAASGPQQTNVNVTLIGDSFGQGAIRGLIGQINGATSDNMRLNVAGRN